MSEPIIEEVRDHASELDLVCGETAHPGMVLSSLDEIPADETAVDISEVNTTDELEELVTIVARVSQMPEDEVRRVNPESLLDDEETRLFVRLVDGHGVASGRLLQIDDVAGVYGIGVAEEFRRRGIGEAMSWEVLRTGRQAGCQVGVLQSSEMAYPLYAKMGFETVVTYHHFERSTQTN